MISLANLGFPSLTPLSSFNSWALSMAAWRSGEMEGEALAREFSRFQLEMAQISAVFRSEIRFQEASGPIVALIESALEKLAVCEDQADVLKEWQDDWEGISEKRVQSLAAALNSLFEVFGKIRELEDKRPRLAASPYIHELLRCLQLYEKKTLAAELISERLAGVSQHFSLLAEQMRQSPIRLAAVEQLIDVLEVQENALQQIAEEVGRGQRPVAAESKRVLHDCAQQALTIHEEVRALSGTPAVWCDGCLGLVRLTHDQICPECGQPVGASEQGEDGLLAVAERACAENRREDWELLQSLSQQSEAQAQEMVKKVKQLPVRQPELEEALGRLAQSVSEIRGFLPGRDAPGLERLLPRLREDLESAAELQQRALEEAQGSK